MNGKRASLILVALFVLASGLLVHNVVPSAHAESSFDNGCYCHNNGIGVWFNGTGYNEYGGPTVKPGATFVLNATSKNIAATGVVPGTQQWNPAMGDNGKFVFKPQAVNDTSSLNLKHQKGNITAIYTITAPSSPGLYQVVMYAQGTTVGFTVQVAGSATTTTTSSGSSSTTSNGSSTSSQTSTGSGTTTSPTTNTTTTSTTHTTTATRPTPDEDYYWFELVVIVAGFALFVTLSVWRYHR